MENGRQGHRTSREPDQVRPCGYCENLAFILQEIGSHWIFELRHNIISDLCCKRIILAAFMDNRV